MATVTKQKAEPGPATQHLCGGGKVGTLGRGRIAFRTGDLLQYSGHQRTPFIQNLGAHSAVTQSFS